MSPSFDGDWLIDRMDPGQITLVEIRQRLVETQTRFQKAELVETASYGKTLVLDDTLQSAQADEWIYHESLVHPALVACPARGQVAILGGGEGASLREVLKHSWVEKAVMVDIDGEVVDFCKQHLDTFHAGAFEDPRTELVIADARAWLARQAEGSYSAIIFDLSEPADEGPSQLLFTAEFFDLIQRVLVPGGVLGMHAGPAKAEATGLGTFFPRLLASVGRSFDRVQPMSAYVYSFSDLWTFAQARKGETPLPGPEQIDDLLADRTRGSLKHYDGECHRHMASLPKYLRFQLAQAWQPFTDTDPASIPS